ncbi:MAG: GAF domain-containing sensor histidine kinase, partial [Patescibacteria group bacterium]
IIDSITKAMGLEKVCVLTIKHYEKDRYSFDIEKASGFNEGDIAKIIRDELLVNYFKDHQKILVVEEVLREMEEHKEKKNYYTKIERLEETLKELDVSICLPLFAKGKLNGMIVLGNKVSKDAYTVQDLELLKTMSDQAAVAMENAQLYEKVQDLNINLKKKVEEATAEINEKNKNLKELLEMKSDFLTVASHQLRTPTSIVRGMLSMLNEDENKMSPKARRDFISQAYGAANNLEHIINDLLSATELEGGKVEYNIEPLDAVEVVEGVVKERGFMAKDKKLKLVLKESKKKLPMVLADPHKLKEVVNNLVDNAIYYTPKGEIEVGFKSGKGELEIYVKDQGIGLSPEDKDKIFGRFIRGDRSLSVNPNGTGLGLYIVDQCIQAMNGRVIAESEGINKGTTFSIFLPSLIE